MCKELGRYFAERMDDNNHLGDPVSIPDVLTEMADIYSQDEVDAFAQSMNLPEKPATLDNDTTSSLQ